jgi:hypothetical protein
MEMRVWVGLRVDFDRFSLGAESIPPAGNAARPRAVLEVRMRRASEFFKLPEVFFILGSSSKHKKPDSLKNEAGGCDKFVACEKHASRHGHYGNAKQMRCDA